MADIHQWRYTDTIAAFFASYPTFRYNRHAESPGFEFTRLCRHMGWERDDTEQKAAWEEFQNAVAKMFNQTYGEDAKSLEAWQKLCRTLRPDATVPDSLEKAKEASTSSRLQHSSRQLTAHC